MIKAIYAIDTDGGFANKGKLPWGKIKSEMQHFMEMTKGQVVVMGHKTWQSLPVRPLFFRTNVVVSRLKVVRHADEYYSGDIIPGLNDVQDRFRGGNVWVIGGKNILLQALPVIQEQHISIIKGTFPSDMKLDLKEMTKDYQQVGGSEDRGKFVYQVWSRVGA